MLLLTTSGHKTAAKWRDDHHGRLITPRSYDGAADTAAEGIPWAADNDCFNHTLDSFRNLTRYTRMLGAIHGQPGCLFVTAPDAVGDAERTLLLFLHWRAFLHQYGLPIALVLQDGMTVDTVPWDIVDAVFIGGSTEWKLGPEAAAIAEASRHVGKWVHMGRVNTARRIQYAQSIGVQSVDGTKWARFRDTYLPGGLQLVAAPAQLRLDADHDGGQRVR